MNISSNIKASGLSSSESDDDLGLVGEEVCVLLPFTASGLVLEA